MVNFIVLRPRFRSAVVNFFKGVLLSTVDFKCHCREEGMERDHKDQLGNGEGWEGGSQEGRRRTWRGGRKKGGGRTILAKVNVMTEAQQQLHPGR